MKKKKKKNKVNENNSVLNDTMPNTISKKDLEKQLEKIKKKRRQLDAMKHEQAKKKLLDELFQEVSSLEKKTLNIPLTDIINNEENSALKENTIEDIIDSAVKEYEDSVEEMQKVLKEEEETFEDKMLSEEEINEFLNSFMERKKEINSTSILAKRKVSDNKKLLSNLNDNKKEVKDDMIHEAQVNRSGKMNQELDLATKIIEDKKIEVKPTINDDDILHKAPLKKESKMNQAIEIAVKEEAIHEAEVKKEMPKAWKDKIELLMQVDNEYLEDLYPRILILTNKQYTNIENKVVTVPLKVPGSKKSYNYVPDKVPTDLEHTVRKENKKIEHLDFYIKQDNDKKEVFVHLDVLKKYGIFPNDNFIMVEETPYYEIREEDIKKISSYNDNSISKIEITYHEIPQEEKELEEAKQVEDDNKTIVINYIPTNIETTNKFIASLKSNENYNIIHSLKEKKTISKDLLSYLKNEEIELPKEEQAEETSREEVPQEIANQKIEEEKEQSTKNQIQQLPDDQLLKKIYENEETDLLKDLDSDVLDRLKRYILRELTSCETLLKEEYANVFYNIGQVKMLEKNLLSSAREDEKISYIQERRLRLKKASSSIENIISIRQDADYLLGKGILINISRVFEEFPLIGMRYNNDIPLELENYIDENSEKLQTALEQQDAEGIITNYINIDSCYYEDMGAGTKIDTSRSIGTKYYDILLNEFRYQDDELANALLEAKALSSADVHVATAEYIYNIKNDKYINDNTLPLSNEHWNMDTSKIGEDVEKLDDTILSYITRKIDNEEVQNELNNLNNSCHNKLVDAVNTIISNLKERNETYPELDINSIQEKLEAIINHPEILSTKRIDGSEAFIKYLSNLPKDALIYLVLTSATNELIKEVYEDALEEDYKQENTK